MALTGDLEDIGFAELLQLLNVGHKSGRLQVWRGEERAELFISQGDVAWARMRFERGPEVVYRVLGWRTGEFSFQRSTERAVREIRESTEALILEGMKRFDEWARVEAEMPEMHVVLRQRAAAAQAFEELSEAAQCVLRLVDARRTVATIVRESGLEPLLALNAVVELQGQGLVEQWAEPVEAAAVLSARDHLPEATGAIEFQAISQTGPGRRGTGTGRPGVTPQGGGNMGKREEHAREAEAP